LAAKSDTQANSQSISGATDNKMVVANAPAPGDARFSAESLPPAPQQNVARRAYQNQKIALNDPMMQVLFVLSYPDASAATETPSPRPAAEPPTATGHVEEGLNDGDR